MNRYQWRLQIRGGGSTAEPSNKACFPSAYTDISYSQYYQLWNTNLSLSLSQGGENTAGHVCLALPLGLWSKQALRSTDRPASTASGKLSQLQAGHTCQEGNSPTWKAVYSTYPEKQLRFDPLEHGIKLPGLTDCQSIFLCYLLGDKWFHESGKHHLQTYFTEEVQCNTFRQMFE